MVAFGRLVVTGRFFLAVLTIYLLYVAITLLLPGEDPQTLKHLQEDISVKTGDGCDGEGCQNVKTGETSNKALEEEAEREENARLKEENAKLLEENVKLKEAPATEQAKPWISANTDVRLWIGTSFCFSFRFDRVHAN